MNVAKQVFGSEPNLPTKLFDDSQESGPLVAVDRIAKYELIVVTVCVIHVPVFGNQLDVVNADVDPDPGLSIPVEVRCLRRVRHVVSRLKVASPVQILDDDV